MLVSLPLLFRFLFSFNDTATTEIYTLSLHDALPILVDKEPAKAGIDPLNKLIDRVPDDNVVKVERDRKSTRLNSSHEWISYAVFCLKKKRRPSNYTVELGTHVSGRDAAAHDAHTRLA